MRFAEFITGRCFVVIVQLNNGELIKLSSFCCDTSRSNPSRSQSPKALCTRCLLLVNQRLELLGFLLQGRSLRDKNQRICIRGKAELVRRNDWIKLFYREARGRPRFRLGPARWRFPSPKRIPVHMKLEITGWNGKIGTFGGYNLATTTRTAAASERWAAATKRKQPWRG